MEETPKNQEVTFAVIEKLKSGQQMFAMEAKTGIIKRASVVKVKGTGKLRMRLDIGYLYLPAMNYANAKRKFENKVTTLLASLEDGSLIAKQ